MSKEWKTVRAVVDIRVRGDYSEKDLVWDVKACLERNTNLSVQHRRAVAQGFQFGKTDVKEMGKVITAAIREREANKKTVEQQMDELRKQIADLGEELRRATNPHRD